jgi:hypothetical protein
LIWYGGDAALPISFGTARIIIVIVAITPGIIALAKALAAGATPRLLTLNMTGNQAGPEGMTAIAEALVTQTVKSHGFTRAQLVANRCQLFL